MLEVAHAREGKFYASDHDLYIGRALLRYGDYCRSEVEMLKQLCGPGDIVVDGGANIGAHTIPLARRVGPHGRVVAFEPQDPVQRTLRMNVELNGLRNVECVHCGLSEAPGTLNFPALNYEIDDNFGAVTLSEAPGVPVRIERLDDVFTHDRLDLLKLDIEGMELQALRGATSLIERHRPILYVENVYLDKSPALISHIRGLGYRMWWHVVAFFDPDNYYGEQENLWPGQGTFNMVCMLPERADMIGLKEVLDPGEHPLKASSASSTR